MSVELRIEVQGLCCCGTPYPTGTEPPGNCRHDVVTDWGKLEHPDARPDRNEVGHLILAPRGWVDSMIRGGKGLTAGQPDFHWTATAESERRFLRLSYLSQHWTWEIFPAHWADGKGPDLYIGRWPD